MASFSDYLKNVQSANSLYAAANGGSKDTTALAGTYGAPNSTYKYNLPGGAPSYIKSNVDFSGYRNLTDFTSKNPGVKSSDIKVADTRNFNYPSNKDNGDPYVPSGYRGSSGSGGAVAQQPDYSQWFNLMMDIMNERDNSLRNAALTSKQKKDDLVNSQVAYSKRNWKKLVADKRNGNLLSSLMNIDANAAEGHRRNASEYEDMISQINAARYNNLSSLTGTLGNMDINTINKIMGML